MQPGFALRSGLILATTAHHFLLVANTKLKKIRGCCLSPLPTINLLGSEGEQGDVVPHLFSRATQLVPCPLSLGGTCSHSHAWGLFWICFSLMNQCALALESQEIWPRGNPSTVIPCSGFLGKGASLNNYQECTQFVLRAVNFNEQCIVYVSRSPAVIWLALKNLFNI